MGELVDRLGNKVAGQLIRSEDWNALVAEVEKINTSLRGRIDELASNVDARITGIEERIGPLESEVIALREQITPFLGQFYRVTLETTKRNYAIGELAEVTARVTDLQGNPIASRPWVDFVTVWGQLKPARDFDDRSGAGGHTISVRTDPEGVAKVMLRSEYVEGITHAEEDDVSVALASTLPQSTVTIADSILNSRTPLEAKNTGAFRMLSVEYDRPDAMSVRKYVDTHFVRNPILNRPPFQPVFGQRWRDYRSTVLASVKDDSDPRTPDQSRGLTSIQVTFRDWIGPWIILDYVTEIGPLVQDFRNRLIPSRRSASRCLRTPTSGPIPPSRK